MKATFFVSTGRCGTSFLSKSMLKDGAFITHELEAPSAKIVMHRYYLPLSKSGDVQHGREITTKYKIPHIQSVLDANDCTEYIDTGHQYNFGMFPHLIEQISNIKIVRLRRDRYETALSFMTAPEGNDIWETKDTLGYFRWMMNPRFKICDVPPGFMNKWEKLSRFQKVLWAIDEVERLWLRLISSFNFRYMEYDFKDLTKGNFASLASFLEADIQPSNDNKSKNSSQYWKRTKPKLTETNMKIEDKALQELYKLYY